VPLDKEKDRPKAVNRSLQRAPQGVVRKTSSHSRLGKVIEKYHFRPRYPGEPGAPSGLSRQLFLKFDIFGSFLRFAVQRRRLKGFTLIEKGTLVSGTEVDRGT
jgi:hypothetical protein